LDRRCGRHDAHVLRGSVQGRGDMTLTITMDDWLRTIEREYLDDFVPQGGAAVKFVAACNGAPPSQLAAQIAQLGRAHEFVTAVVSASDTRVHMLDKLFNEVARQMPWRELVVNRLAELAVDSYRIPESLGLGGFASEIAEANDTDESYVRMIIEK